MTRTLVRPLRALAALAVAALAPGCSQAPPPNLILITVDTLRADHTSLHGYDRRTTPALEALARRGTTFERTSSSSSWTLPSMHTILTGEFRVENGGNMQVDQRTLAELLSRHGYRTAGVAANALLSEELGFQRGHGVYQVIPPPKPGSTALNGWVGEEVVDRGLAWLDRGEGPFFLHLHLFDPHGPYEPTRGNEFPVQRTPERFAAHRDATPEEFRSLFDEKIYTHIEELVSKYDSEVLQADRAIARVLAHLEQRGLADDTLVVFTSDHGEGLWQRARNPEENTHGGLYFPPLYQGHGGMLHSEQVHVPLVLAGPGVPRGARRTEDVSLVDLLPTLLGRLGIAAPRQADGRDLFASGSERRPVFTICSRGTAVTVDGRWRLHQPAEYRLERHGAVPELFDLEVDPLELDPVDDPQRIRRMQALIADWRAAHRRREEDRMGTTSDAHIDALRALGYAGEVDAEGSATTPTTPEDGDG